MALWLDFADAMAFLGLAGTALAIASAIVAATALAIIGAPDAGVVAVAGWVAGVLLSLGGFFVSNWHLPTVALASLPLALVLAGAIGLIRASIRPRAAGK